MKHVVFVTDTEYPQGTTDDRHLYAAAREIFDVRVVAWDEDDQWPLSADAIVLRSTWNYHKQVDGWRQWLERLDDCDAPVFNAPSIVRWNYDKKYLLDVQQQGHTIVPTELRQRGVETSLCETLTACGWQQAVVKPAVSATARGTWRAEADTESETRFQRQLLEEDLLIQPYCPSIEIGEVSMMFFNGEYSHSVRKSPKKGDFRVQSDFGGTVDRIEPPPYAREAAARMLADVSPLPLYARVDGVIEDGEFLMMELELIEPELFFRVDDASPSRFLDALATRMEDGRG